MNYKLENLHKQMYNNNYFKNFSIQCHHLLRLYEHKLLSIFETIKINILCLLY